LFVQTYGETLKTSLQQGAATDFPSYRLPGSHTDAAGINRQSFHTNPLRWTLPKVAGYAKSPFMGIYMRCLAQLQRFFWHYKAFYNF